MRRYFLGVLAFAQISFGISLKEAINSAVKYNTDILYQKLNTKIASEKRKEAFGNFLPSIGFNATSNVGRELAIPEGPTSFVFQKGHFTQWTFGLKQPLFNMPSFYKYKISKDDLKAQKYMLTAIKTDIKIDVMDTYINALVRRKLIDVDKKEVKDYQRHLYNVEKMYEQGLVAFKDILQTKVKLNQAKQKLAQDQGKYKVYLQKLSNLIGRPVHHLEDIGSISNPLSKYDLNQLVGIALRNRVILKYGKALIKKAKDYQSLTKSTYLPQAYIEARYGYSDQIPGLPYYQDLLSAGISWKLFNGLKRFHEVHQAFLAYKQAKVNYQKLENDIKLQVTASYEALKTAEKDIVLARSELKDAKEHYKIASEKYKVGLGTNTDVIDAEDYLTKARTDVVRSRYLYALAVYKLIEVVAYGQK
ncbi:TolC family protein [Hydrogenobaculum acidophilum]